MLAQNFLTADSLEISEAERDALVKVLGMLERGELKHTPPYRAVPMGFNMQVLSHINYCGTIACIAGWAQLIAPGERLFSTERSYNANLRDLFCIIGRGVELTDVTAPQAATALRNYLTRGAPHWDEALA